MADYSQGPVGGNVPPVYAEQHRAVDHSGKDIPPYPSWLKFLLIPIALLIIIVLGLVAYCVNTLGTGAQSLGFNLFAIVWSILVLGYLFLIFWAMPHFHFKWVVIGLIGFSSLWWLVAFAYLASDAKKFADIYKLLTTNYYDNYTSGYYSGKLVRRDLDKRQYGGVDIGLFGHIDYASFLDDPDSAESKINTVKSCLAAGAGIGALVWILFLVFTVIYALALFRGRSQAPPPPVAAQANYEQKVEMQPYAHQQYPPQPVMSPPPQVYSPAPQQYVQQPQQVYHQQAQQ